MGKSKAIIASYVGTLVFAAFIFLGAWKFWYWQGFLYTVLALLGTTLNHLIMPKGSTLTESRAEKAGSGVSWDKKLLGLISIMSLVTFVVAGLDSGRFHWSGSVSAGVTVLGVVILVTGQILFALAKRANAFFSSTVRLQSEDGHRVCDAGVYRFVRHPGYLGLILSNIGFPLVLNSYFAFIPAAAGIALLVARTALEDRFLAQNLGGYKDYSARIRSRLVPFIY